MASKTKNNSKDRDTVDDGAARLTDKIERTRARGKSYSMDLRIHSPASLGYVGIEGLDSAPALVRLARVKGLDVVAVTDFYTGEFIDRVTVAANGSNLTIIPGVVVRSRIGACDDVIISCLFPESFTSAQIDGFLAAIHVPDSARGKISHILNISFDELLETIDSFGGVAIPSRIDKTPHRMQVLSTLVEKYGFRAFDLAYSDSNAIFKTRWPKIKFQLFNFSNAQALAQVGSRTVRVKMENPGFVGIRDMVQRGERI